MNSKLFVAGLDWGIEDATLKTIFEPYGEVISAQVVTDRATGRSRGFGFVEMSTEADAEKCVKNLNETEHMGRTIVVKYKENDRQR